MKELSLTTKTYLAAVYILGAASFLHNIRSGFNADLPILIILCMAASILHIAKVVGTTVRSHYTFSFLIYGFTFVHLGLGATLIVILVSNLAEWAWNKPPWFIQTFNISNYSISIWGASIAFQLMNPSGTTASSFGILSLIASMTVFTFLNHLLLAIILWLARGENLKVSRMMDFFPFVMDLTVLLVGCMLELVWEISPFGLLLFLFPLYLIYTSLRIPALERQSETDSKTGLFNHAHFKKQMSSEMARANRFDRPLSVILGDLDLLRNINNTYGHLAGDDVLIGISKILNQSVRDYDVVARFGGEEFAILLPETELSQAFARSEYLRKTIEKQEFVIGTSPTPIRVSMSFGVAQRENFNQTAEEILHNADLALYHSKLSGRNKSYAYKNEEYLEISSSSTDQAPNNLTPAAVIPGDGGNFTDSAVRHPVDDSDPKYNTNDVSNNIEPIEEKKDGSRKSGRKSGTSDIAARLFAFTTFLASLLAFTATLRSLQFEDIYPDHWGGLVILCLLIVISELLSIDLYSKRSSVSTSAVPILLSVLLYGPVGVVLSSLVVALSLFIKYRSPFNRFLFNIGTHILAGTVTLLIVYVFGNDFLGISILSQIAICLLAATSLFLITSWMVALGMSLDLKHSILEIWRDKFEWLVPYYVGIGFIAYSMVFGFQYKNIVGLLLMTIPMFLLRVSQKQYVDRTRQVVEELREKNQVLVKKSDEITELNEGLLMTLAEIIDLRDPFVLGHSYRVTNYATRIGTAMGLNSNQIEAIRKGSLLHDIGKLGIPMEILLKPGKLTPEEFNEIKRHPEIGTKILENSPALRQLMPIVRHHHEKYNGQGYPDGLSGSQIPLEVRIVSLADTIEAMSSDRPYRKARSLEYIFDELRACSGTQFDPIVVEHALQLLKSGEFLLSANQLTESRMTVFGSRHLIQKMNTT